MKLTHSELNFACAKHVRNAFGFTEGELMNLIVAGKVQMYRKYKDPLVVLDSLATAMYSDRENVVMKRWDYDYESVQKKYAKVLKKLFCFPRCFFKAEEGIADGYYRVFYQQRMLRMLVYVMDGVVKCVCYNRENDSELELVYRASIENRIDWEG